MNVIALRTSSDAGRVSSHIVSDVADGIPFSIEPLTFAQQCRYQAFLRDLDEGAEGEHGLYLYLSEDVEAYVSAWGDAVTAAGYTAAKSASASAQPESLEEVTRRHVAHVLEYTGGNMSEAARILGMDRRTLYRWAPKRDARGRPSGLPRSLARTRRLREPQ
jgi:Bacterial regulatory protein, Fis family